jgi:hypothetical protein
MDVSMCMKNYGRSAYVQDYARKLVVLKNPNILQEEDNELEKKEKEERSS